MCDCSSYAYEHPQLSTDASKLGKSFGVIVIFKSISLTISRSSLRAWGLAMATDELGE